MADLLKAFDLQGWIDQHRELLKPPVGAQMIWENSQFRVMTIGGPNARRDFHIDPSDEFFYQLEGDMVLEYINPEGKRCRETIREGQILLLPANVPHSPQRPAESVGLVVERARASGEPEGYAWYCERCDQKLYELASGEGNILEELDRVNLEFNHSEPLRTCRVCGYIQPAPEGPRL